MTHRERVERFITKMYTNTKERAIYDWEMIVLAPQLESEFDAVAREAAAQMREQAKKIISDHMIKDPKYHGQKGKYWDTMLDGMIDDIEAIRALPVTDVTPNDI